MLSVYHAMTPANDVLLIVPQDQLNHFQFTTVLFSKPMYEIP